MLGSNLSHVASTREKKFILGLTFKVEYVWFYHPKRQLHFHVFFVFFDVFKTHPYVFYNIEMESNTYGINLVTTITTF
jgi:hypothetical protein